MNREGYERSMISDERMRDIFGAVGKCNIGRVSGQRTSEASDTKSGRSSILFAVYQH